MREQIGAWSSVGDDLSDAYCHFRLAPEELCHCIAPSLEGGQVGDLQGHELRLQRGPADNGPVGLSSHEAVASHGPGASSHSDLHGRPPEG